MDEKEMAVAIVEAFMRMEAEIEARGALLDRCWRSPDSPWGSLVFDQMSEILNRQTSRQRIAEFRSASNNASDGDSLIRSLHQEILRRSKV